MKRIVWWGLLGLVVLVLALRVAGGEMRSPFADLQGFGVWFAAFLTLAIVSFLYNDNPIYRFAEHLFVGVSAAYWMVMGFWSTLVPNLLGKLWPSLTARWFMPGLAEQARDPLWFLYLIPLAFGILLLTRLLPKGGHLSRWALAFILGTTAGLRLIAYLTADFMGQVQATLVSVAGYTPALTPGGAGVFSFERMFWDLVAVVAILSALSYFYFSKAHTGAFGRFSRLGIWVLMVTFGAGFGYTVMGRVALLVGRVEFLLADWLSVL
ncbi:MAG: hypothetical protein FJY75_06975 [Candidatus Eisenbacteria bacterium]|uniref:Uncharacterized protein n=1 Tax=Eiseniibacteriota bacterium TaxID=2212470 RepID=A0A938BQS9_UNCEI|nr:hypothetical protein [Candidatus Eisenbacteria bacterium]